MFIYPCSKDGRILKGFCPTVCESAEDVARTLAGWIRFAGMFKIKFWFNGDKVVKL